jgi:hypothetical protein
MNIIPDNAAEVTATDSTFRSRMGRKAAALVLLPLASLGMVAALAPAAGANVNTGPGSAPYTSVQWGDCHVVVGSPKVADGAAEGGVDVSCAHTWYISEAVTLYEFTTAGWRVARTYATGWYGPTGGLSAHTGGVCGARASWYTVGTVYVNNGSQTYKGSWASPVGTYDPPC